MTTSTWTPKNKQVVLALTYSVIVFAVTVGFAGFSGFKSLNLVALALPVGFISFGIFIIGFIGSRVSEKSVWKNLKIGGRWSTYAVVILIVGQMIGQIR